MAVYDVFTPECLNDLFPIQRTNDFFDALFGDAEEGAYDIRLVVDPEESDDGELHFYFELHQRAGRCLVCSLTYGLPQVFERDVYKRQLLLFYKLFQNVSLSQ